MMRSNDRGEIGFRILIRHTALTLPQRNRNRALSCKRSCTPLKGRVGIPHAINSLALMLREHRSFLLEAAIQSARVCGATTLSGLYRVF